MSLVSDIMNKVSPLQQGGVFGNVSGVNLNDTTFSNLLEKAMNTQVEEKTNDIFMQLGAPAGFEFQEINTDEVNNMSTKKIDENLLDFAKKQATNMYYKCSGSVITDINEFVEDALTTKTTNFIASMM